MNFQTFFSTYGNIILSILGLIALVFLAFFSIKSYKKNREKANIEKAEFLNVTLQNKKVSSVKLNTPLQFNDGLNSLSLVPNQIISVDFNGGESTFTFQNLQGVQSKSLRLDAKTIQKVLSEFDQFMLVNSQKLVNSLAIQHVEGNADGFQLEIAQSSGKTFVPNSYSKNLHR